MGMNSAGGRFLARAFTCSREPPGSASLLYVLLPSQVMQATEGPVPTGAADTVFLHALVGETKPVSPWRSPPGH